jgi:hypothetical protein
MPLILKQKTLVKTPLRPYHRFTEYKYRMGAIHRWRSSHPSCRHRPLCSLRQLTFCVQMHKICAFQPPILGIAPGTCDLCRPQLGLFAVLKEVLRITYDFEKYMRPVTDATKCCLRMRIDLTWDRAVTILFCNLPSCHTDGDYLVEIDIGHSLILYTTEE